MLAGAVAPTLVRISGQARLTVLGPRGSHDDGLLGSVARTVLHRAASPTLFAHGRPVPPPRAPLRAGNALAR
jgi:hypothetical protein